MYIEWLKFRVQPELRSQFIQLDQQIWTTFIAKSPAFVSKEIWLNPDQPNEVITLIHWSDREQWKAIPAADVDRVEQSFRMAFGADSYELIEAQEYQIASSSRVRL